MDVDFRRRWVRSLSARGIPRGHVAFVLGLDESVVVADLAPSRDRKLSSAMVPEIRVLHAKGWSLRALAKRYNVSHTSVRKRLAARPRCPRKSLPFHHKGRHELRQILGHTGTKVRRFHELGYKPVAIAAALMLNVVAVEDFLARITPLRRCRVKPDKMVRPRGRLEDQAAQRNRLQAEARRLARLERVSAPRLLLRDNSGTYAAEIADYARLIGAIREGRLSAAELVNQAGVFYAPPRRAAGDVPAVEPAIWTGAVNPNPGNPKLDPEKIAEMRVLRAQGWSTGALAKRYDVTRATICYALSGRTFREERPPTPPPALLGRGSPFTRKPRNLREIRAFFRSAASQSGGRCRKSAGW